MACSLPGTPEAETMIIQGSCHCANLRFRLETRKPLTEIEPRACDCSFCRAHGAKCWSDPEGSAVVQVADETLLQRYRFAAGTADFLVCRRCGVYLGALISAAGQTRATLNLRTSELHDLPAVRAAYGGEDARSRVRRRLAKWTPATLVIANGSGASESA